jgi:hypothetical protein
LSAEASKKGHLPRLNIHIILNIHILAAALPATELQEKLLWCLAGANLFRLFRQHPCHTSPQGIFLGFPENRIAGKVGGTGLIC